MKHILTLYSLLSLTLWPLSAFTYELHNPVIVENIQATGDKPYIVEAYEIANPDGPGIQKG